MLGKVATITVIVPVYKVEKYLRRCIDSLLSQTFSNLQILLVNDGSPDKCPQICDEYAFLDSRVRVIHQENQGLSGARNTGIEASNSPYIGFVDSDDWVHPQFYEILYYDIVQHGAEIATCSYQEVSTKISVKNHKWDANETEVFGKRQALEHLLTATPQGGHTAWNKLYKRELFNSVRYPKGRIYEDAATTYRLYYLAETITYNQAPYYYYWQRPDSIMSRPFDQKNMDKILSANEVVAFFKKNNPTYNMHAEVFLAISALRTMADLLISEEQHAQEYQILLEILSNPALKTNPYLPIRHKWLLRLFHCSPKVYTAVWKKRLKNRE